MPPRPPAFTKDAADASEARAEGDGVKQTARGKKNLGEAGGAPAGTDPAGVVLWDEIAAPEGAVENAAKAHDVVPVSAQSKAVH